MVGTTVVGCGSVVVGRGSVSGVCCGEYDRVSVVTTLNILETNIAEAKDNDVSCGECDDGSYGIDVELLDSSMSSSKTKYSK